jgi:hypothetical protein
MNRLQTSQDGEKARLTLAYPPNPKDLKYQANHDRIYSSSVLHDAVPFPPSETTITASRRGRAASPFPLMGVA